MPQLGSLASKLVQLKQFLLKQCNCNLSIATGALRPDAVQFCDVLEKIILFTLFKSFWSYLKELNCYNFIRYLKELDKYVGQVRQLLGLFD